MLIRSAGASCTLLRCWAPPEGAPPGHLDTVLSGLASLGSTDVLAQASRSLLPPVPQVCEPRAPDSMLLRECVLPVTC